MEQEAAIAIETIPVTHSILDADALLALIARVYPLDPPIACTLLRHSWNDSYHLTTLSTRYVVRVYAVLNPLHRGASIRPLCAMMLLMHMRYVRSCGLRCYLISMVISCSCGYDRGRLRTNSSSGPASRTLPPTWCASAVVWQSVVPQRGHTGSTAATVKALPPKRLLRCHSSQSSAACRAIQKSTVVEEPQTGLVRCDLAARLAPRLLICGKVEQRSALLACHCTFGV